jgi:serine/threonine protein kinase
MAKASPAFPMQFGRYRLLRKLAQGGMAELFLATRPGSSQPVVIKRVLPHFCSDTEFLAMFLNEARIAAQLNHPNIVGIYDLGQEGEHIYIAMEFIDGSDLERLTREAGGVFPPHLAARIAACICDALYYANRQTDLTSGKPLNVIHRDVTPGNVMITRQGVVKLVDFGVAKATAQLERTKPGVVKGKFRYMSPEQVQLQELDGRSDLFSLGVLLYEVTTGKKPFDRPQVIEIIRALTSWDPPAPADIVPRFPRPLSDVILQALRKDPNTRFRDAREMQVALEDALAQMPPASTEDLGVFVRRYLDPPIELEEVLPPWEQHGGKTDPSAAYPVIDDESDPLRTDEITQHDPRGASDVATRSLEARGPATPPPAKATRTPAPPLPVARQPPTRTPHAVPAAARPAPVAAPPVEPSPFDEDEKTTLAPGPFAGPSEPPRLERAGASLLQRPRSPTGTMPMPKRSSASLAAVALGGEEDDAPATVTNKRSPPAGKQSRGLQTVILVLALICLAIHLLPPRRSPPVLRPPASSPSMVRPA